MPSRLTHLKKKAQALAEQIPLGRLHPAPQQWLRAFRSRSVWAIALSGGADSVALLLLLWAHYPERRHDFAALHYNHRLRGPEADTDEAFCRQLCAKLGVPFTVGRRPDALELRSEAAAREARFEFFFEEMAVEGSRILWLGHQQNDVAETLLMRLVRGSGTAGLAAPRPVQAFPPTPEIPRERVHLRPLLTLPRADIEAALRDCEIPWREDATNAHGKFFRNRIRHDALPALIAAVQPSVAASVGGEGQAESRTADEGEPTAPREARDALAGMALSRELLDEDAAALEAWAQSVAVTVIHDGVLDLRTLNAERGGLRLPRAVKRRVLHLWLREHAGAPALSRQAFEALLAAVETSRSTRQSLGLAHFALIRRHTLRLEHRSA